MPRPEADYVTQGGIAFGAKSGVSQWIYALETNGNEKAGIYFHPKAILRTFIVERMYGRHCARLDCQQKELENSEATVVWTTEHIQQSALHWRGENSRPVRSS